MALLGALGLQMLVCLFFSPFGHRGPQSQTDHVLVYTAGGFILAMPMLAAIGTVLGPWRWWFAFPFALAMMALLVHLAYFSGGHGETDFTTIVVLTYLFLQLPLWAVRVLRRWRIVLPGAGELWRRGYTQFSLRWMLGVATVACVMLAILRWTKVPYRWPGSATIWQVLREAAWPFALSISSASLTGIPLLAAVLAQTRRHRSLAVAIGGVAVTAAVLFGLALPRNSDSGWLIKCSLPAGAAWIVLNLLVLRWGGFRLVQQPRGESAVVDRSSAVV